MPILLNEVEARVLGSLVEKQITTPEYYPLTLNALTAACNQRSNREPVVSYDEKAVLQAIESLRERNLAYVFYGSTSRVPKYKHMMPEVFELNGQQLAILCTLILRGHHTVGELRERASRLYEFPGLGEVNETLNSLINKEPEPLVVQLERQTGQKEVRYAHLLSGEVSVASIPVSEYSASRSISSRIEPERVLKLEQDVEALRAEIEILKQQFEDFRKQFE